MPTLTKQSDVARAVLMAILADGWQYRSMRVNTTDRVMAELMDRDMLRVWFTKRGAPHEAWVLFMWQGPDDDSTVDPYEIVCDYITSLSPAIDPVLDMSPI